MRRNLILLIILTFCIYFLPGDYMSWTSCYIISIMLVLDLYYKRNIIVISFFFILALSISFIYYILGFKNITSYIGTMFYSLLAVLALANLIAGYWVFLKEKPDKRYLDTRSYRITQLLIILFQIIAIFISLTAKNIHMAIMSMVIAMMAEYYCPLITRGITHVFNLKRTDAA